MGLANQKQIAVTIHSVDYAVKSRICGIDGRELIISTVTGKTDMFQKNDPVVCIYLDQNRLQYTGGDVKAVRTADSEVEILLNDSKIIEEKRLFVRYPVSAALSARKKFESKRRHFLAKNISLYGIGAVSAAVLDADEIVDLDLISGKHEFSFSGKVIWKDPIDGGYDYGFQLIGFDIATKMSYEAYLDNLNKEYSELYNRAR